MKLINLIGWLIIICLIVTCVLILLAQYGFAGTVILLALGILIGCIAAVAMWMIER